jgi:tetratricopeptide (TPR) repeat protein
MRFALPLLLATIPIFAQDPPDAKAPDIGELQKAARAAYSKGKYPEARTALEQAWELAQQTPAKDPQRYDVLKQLSGVLSASGGYAAAQAYVELAINWRETAVSPEDPKLADEWIELASLCQRQKDYERALALLQRAQMTHTRENGPESIPVADDFSRIALVYMAEQKPDLSTRPLEQTIAIREKVLGAEHPAILSELDRLGSAWITLREYTKAEDTFRRALVIRERLLGPTDAGLISTVEGLGYSLFGQRRFEEAEPYYMRLLSLWKISTGDPAHPMVAMTLDKIAVFYRAQDRWDEGNRAAEDAAALRELFLATGLSQDATARQGHGDKKTAAKLFAQALGVLDESRPEHDELRAQLQKNLEELQIEVKPARKSTGKKSTDKL